MIGRLLSCIRGLFGMPRVWLPALRYSAPWPAERPGKSGVAAVKRRARKARNRRRARHA